MSWTSAVITLPAALTSIRQQAEGVLGQVPSVMNEATGWLPSCAIAST